MDKLASAISIHALREEGDADGLCDLRRPGNFYPRPPRGGRRSGASRTQRYRRISIHALREEGDFKAKVSQSDLDISIHALREEGDSYAGTPYHLFGRFLSTPSARRATCLLGVYYHLVDHFYPRPPRGGRLPGLRPDEEKPRISIHALREEGDRLGGSWWT